LRSKNAKITADLNREIHGEFTAPIHGHVVVLFKTSQWRSIFTP